MFIFAHMRRDVFKAIADPTRREIIGLLASKPMNLNAIAGNFSVSRPAISKHIRILSECGLVSIQNEGRERLCKVNLSPLNQVNGWTESLRGFRKQKLDALGDFLERAD